MAESDPCPVCSDARRDPATLCVVEAPADMMAVEKSGVPRALPRPDGKIAPLDGVGPESLRIDELVARVKRGGVTEVIIATGSDVEGRRQLYLSRSEAVRGRCYIAHGIPMGSSLDFSDEVTIKRALEGRAPL